MKDHSAALAKIRQDVESLPDEVDGLDLRGDKRQALANLDMIGNTLLKLRKLSTPAPAEA